MRFPPIVQKIWRTTGWIVLSLILFVYAYLGLAYMLSRITYAEEPDEPRTYELFHSAMACILILWYLRKQI